MTDGRFCLSCDRMMGTGEHLRNGRCSACNRYRDRNGIERGREPRRTTVPDVGVDWDQAACRYVDPDQFVPESGQSTWSAKQVCRECPIMRGCREFGLLVSPDSFGGVYGALSERERREIRGGRLTEAEADARDAEVAEAGSFQAYAGLRGGEGRRQATRRTPVECGEPSAYQRHRRNGEDPCDACTEAYRTYQREHKRRQAARRRGEAA